MVLIFRAKLSKISRSGEHRYFRKLAKKNYFCVVKITVKKNFLNTLLFINNVA